MKLKEKIFEVTDEKGNPLDLSQETNISVIINGIDSGLKINDIFRNHSLIEDVGTIYGTSLLSYFTPKDGKLIDGEGHTVEFFDTNKNPILVIDNTDEPFFDDDSIISFEYIKAFSELVGIKKADELFAPLLSDEEKEIFASERKSLLEKEESTRIALEQKEAIEKEKQEADTIELEKQKEADYKKKLDDELRSKISPDYIVEEKKYKEYQKFYSDNNFKEYISGNVHLFYNKDWRDYKEDPFVLVKRGDKWWEDVETEVDDIHEYDKRVALVFVDGTDKKTVVLDLEKQTISLAGVVTIGEKDDDN